MSRRLKLHTRELGPLELFFIYQTGSLWEAEWAPFQRTSFASLLPVISDEVVNHALRGWTQPFIQALGLAPSGALRKVPKEHQQCDHRARCPFYAPSDCQPTGKRLPNCFQPEHLTDQVGVLAYEVIRLWRESVYVVVVQESADAHRTYPRAHRG